MDTQQISGVYAIVNTTNNMMYIGSSGDIHGRFYHHKRRLNANENGSKEFQKDWNEAEDKNIFELRILESLDNPIKEELFEREQFYLDHFSKLGVTYNHCSVASGGNGSGEKHPFYNRPVPEETKEKISDTLTGRTLSEEHRKNITKSLIGHQRLTEESIRRIKEKQRKLTDEQVIEILQRLKTGEATRKIAEDYPVGGTVIKNIRNNIAYTHIIRN